MTPESTPSASSSEQAAPSNAGREYVNRKSISGLMPFPTARRGAPATTILIADDDAVSRTVLERTLRGWGHEVIASRDGQEAWEVLRSEDPPKLAVLDWMMPGLEGPEICRRVRALARPVPTYVINSAENGLANFATSSLGWRVAPMTMSPSRSTGPSFGRGCVWASGWSGSSWGWLTGCANWRRPLARSSSSRGCCRFAGIARRSATIATTGNGWRPISPRTQTHGSATGSARTAGRTSSSRN